MDVIKESRWYKVINGGVGLASIVFALIFFAVVTFYFVLRTYQSVDKNKLFSNLTAGGDRPKTKPKSNPRNTIAKFLRITIFLLLALGFVAVFYYNVDKMATDDPLVSVKVENNTYTPSILFCAATETVEVSDAGYYVNIDDDEPIANLTDLFNNIILGKGEKQMNCTLFDDKLFKIPEGKIGGDYRFTLSSNTYLVFIGDFNEIDKSHFIPQGSAHSSIGTQLINTQSTILTYEETRYKDLDGGKIHRNYQFSLIGNFNPESEEKFVEIIAPPSVIINTEEPPLDLAQLFGNIGGYLTICGIFGFLFGSGKVSPFGFVTEYCFQYKDLDNDLEEGGEANSRVEDNETKDISGDVNESKFETLVRKYYVDLKPFK